jgi:hypothetical protein
MTIEFEYIALAIADVNTPFWPAKAARLLKTAPLQNFDSTFSVSAQVHFPA